VYIDESAQDITVTVEGEDYEAEPTVDIDDDGVDDTVMVETDDGAIAFTDTDSDGQADLMTQLDADGDVIGQARYDESSGDWVRVEPDSDSIDVEQTADGGAGSMTVETPGGDVQVGAPTHDTDSDGKADSTVVRDPDGDTMIFTDADEDGDADFATEITGDGQVTVSQHTGDGEWLVIERGHLDEDGNYQRDDVHAESGTISEENAWSDSGRQDADEVRVDPRSGTWVRG
jgi:hypothetical protein